MQDVVNLYFEIWKNQDSARISEIFNDDARYVVHPYGIEEYKGIEAIKGYWNAKPVRNQINPQPRIINQVYGNDQAFIEWETIFDKKSGEQKKVRGIMILEFRNEKIAELREHYDSTE